MTIPTVSVVYGSSVNLESLEYRYRKGYRCLGRTISVVTSREETLNKKLRYRMCCERVWRKKVFNKFQPRR